MAKQQNGTVRLGDILDFTEVPGGVIVELIGRGGKIVKKPINGGKVRQVEKIAEGRYNSRGEISVRDNDRCQVVHIPANN